MADRDLTRRRLLALSGAAVGAALGIGLGSCSKRAPEPGKHPGPGSTEVPGTAGKSGPEGPGAR
ncbi:twin-arginine translocation signal domain-containing protein [Streptomyces sp. NPDC127066]|uniref:twin-arginine translocation signal domain-containing protein n=1 Tax=Streptomyces sp. NPDC127066 TaxID=3347125 RepID=UPI00365931AD